jgi:hypothetical protein
MSYSDGGFAEVFTCIEQKPGAGGGGRDEVRGLVRFVMAVVAQKNHMRILERERGESKRSCVYIDLRRRLKELARHSLFDGGCARREAKSE